MPLPTYEQQQFAPPAFLHQEKHRLWQEQDRDIPQAAHSDNTPSFEQVEDGRRHIHISLSLHICLQPRIVIARLCIGPELIVIFTIVFMRQPHFFITPLSIQKRPAMLFHKLLKNNGNQKPKNKKQWPAEVDATQTRRTRSINTSSVLQDVLRCESSDMCDFDGVRVHGPAVVGVQISRLSLNRACGHDITNQVNMWLQCDKISHSDNVSLKILQAWQWHKCILLNQDMSMQFALSQRVTSAALAHIDFV